MLYCADPFCVAFGLVRWYDVTCTDAFFWRGREGMIWQMSRWPTTCWLWSRMFINIRLVFTWFDYNCLCRRGLLLSSCALFADDNRRQTELSCKREQRWELARNLCRVQLIVAIGNSAEKLAFMLRCEGGSRRFDGKNTEKFWITQI